MFVLTVSVVDSDTDRCALVRAPGLGPKRLGVFEGIEGSVEDKLESEKLVGDSVGAVPVPSG
jgi:hypothetical protein